MTRFLKNQATPPRPAEQTVPAKAAVAIDKFADAPLDVPGDQLYPREENALTRYDRQPHFRSGEAVQRFLAERCGLRISQSTLAALLAGNLGTLAFSPEGMAEWARCDLGSHARPTLSPAEGCDTPPRVLLIGAANSDNHYLAAQLNAYGADVFGPVPTDEAEGRLDPEQKDAKRYAATETIDFAWVDIAEPRSAVLFVDWLNKLGIPHAVTTRQGGLLPPQLREVALPPKFSVDDIPRILAQRLPIHVRDRLDLTKPLIENWDYYDENVWMFIDPLLPSEEEEGP